MTSDNTKLNLDTHRAVGEIDGLYLALSHLTTVYLRSLVEYKVVITPNVHHGVHARGFRGRFRLCGQITRAQIGGYLVSLKSMMTVRSER